MTPANSWLVGYELTRVGEGSAIYPRRRGVGRPRPRPRGGAAARGARRRRRRARARRARAPRRRGLAVARAHRRRDARAARAAARARARRTPRSPARRAPAARCRRRARRRAYDPASAAGGGAGDLAAQGTLRAMRPYTHHQRELNDRLRGRARGAGAAASTSCRRSCAAASTGSPTRAGKSLAAEWQRRGAPAPARRARRGRRVTRGDAVVCVPVYGARELFEQCLRSVVEHTPPGTRVLVADDASPDPGIQAFTRAARRRGAARRSSSYVRRAENLGFVAQHERRLPRHRAGRRRDRQLRHRRARARGSSACAPPPTPTGSWRPPARSPTTARSSRSPTATGPSPLPPPGLSITEADARIARASPRLYPRIPTGDRALPLHPPLGARARRRLRRDVLARLRRGGRLLPALPRARAAPRGRRRPLRLPPRRGLVRRRAQRAPDRQRGRAQPPLPLLREGGATRPRPSEGIPLARSLAAARLAVGELSVTIDGSCLGPTLTGTQVLALELAGALARRRRRAAARHRAALARRPRARRARRARGRADVARRGRRGHRADRHRPPALPGDDAARPAAAGPARPPRRAHPARLDRLPQPRLLRRLRRVARLPRADARRRSRSPTASCSSRRTRATTRAPRTSSTTSARGSCRSASTTASSSPDTEPVAPAGVEGRPFLLCLGTDFLHKNRLFALALFERAARSATASTAGSCSPARTRRAGPRPARRRRGAPRTRGSPPTSSTLGECPEAEKAWLYRNAALVLYPTTFEGFGFVPFEAAEAGAPSLWADAVLDGRPAARPSTPGSCRGTSRRARRNAAAADRRPGGARGARRRRARRRPRSCTWDRTAERLLGVYREAATAPRARRPPSRASRCRTSRCRSSARAAGSSPDDQQALLAVSTRPGAQAHGVQRAARRLPRDVPGRGA